MCPYDDSSSERSELLTLGVIRFTSRGATIPGTVAKVLLIPNNSAAYLHRQVDCFIYM